MEGEYGEICGHLTDIKKQRRIRRIAEYEKFLTNCEIVRERIEIERDKRSKETLQRRNTVVALNKTKPDYILMLKSSSLSYLDVFNSGPCTEEAVRTDRFSMPPLPSIPDRSLARQQPELD